MNAEQYVDLRCALNNVNYEVIDGGLSKGKFDSVKIEKKVKDISGNIKYVITYYLRDFDPDLKQTAYDNKDYRFSASVAASFFIKRVDADMTSINNKSYNDNYDCLGVHYYFDYYKDPKEIETIIETIWNSLNIFSNNPYIKKKENNGSTKI